MDVKEELDLIFDRMKSDNRIDVLGKTANPPPPAFPAEPPAPPEPAADSQSGGSVTYTLLGSAPSHMYSQPGTDSQGQLPVNNIPVTTRATVLLAPPHNSCAPKKHETEQGKDQAYIKKSPNAFMLYLKEQRPKVTAKLNISDSAAVNAAVGERWNLLSKEEQKKYFDHAETERRHHAQKHPDWSPIKNCGKKKKRVRGHTCTKAMKEPHQPNGVWVCQPQTQPGVHSLIGHNTVLLPMPNSQALVCVPLCAKCNLPQIFSPSCRLYFPPSTPLISSPAPTSSAHTGQQILNYSEPVSFPTQPQRHSSRQVNPCTGPQENQTNPSY